MEVFTSLGGSRKDLPPQPMGFEVHPVGQVSEPET